MKRRIIGIITDNRTGVSIAQRYKNCGYDVVVCINDDNGALGNAEKHSLAKSCDESKIDVCLDQISFSAMIGEKEALVFFVKVYGGFSVSFMENFINILPAKTIFANSCKNNFHEAMELERHFLSKKCLFLTVSIICSESVSEQGPVFLACGDNLIFEQIRADLETVAAIYESSPCCFFYTNPGLGCYVVSVHDAAFRALIDIFSDSVMFLNKILGYDYNEIHDLLLEWNDTLLKSSVTLLVADILSRTEFDGNNYLIDSVDNTKSVKIAPAVLSIGFIRKYYPNIFEGSNIYNNVDIKEISTDITGLVKIPEISDFKKHLLTDAIFKTIQLAFLSIFEQSFCVIKDYCKKSRLDINYSIIGRAFYAGGQLTSTVLREITGYFEGKMQPEEIFSEVTLKRMILNNLPDLRSVVATSVESGLSLSSFYFTLSYFDTMKNDHLSKSFLQLAYDCIYDFGYYRKGNDSLFSADWGSLSRETSSKEKEE